MIPNWTGEVVGRLHIAGITQRQLAKECGYTWTYLSAVLHERKGNDRTRQKIIEALERLEERARREADALDGTG